MTTEADRRPAGLLLVLAGAAALRVGVAGPAGARSAPAGLLFGALLLAAAAAARARVPARTGLRTAPGRDLLVGAGGGAVLCLVPLGVALTRDLVRLPAAGFPRWALVVAVVAVAEEVLLRGVLVDALADRPEALQLLVPTVAFALLHVPLYGWHVLPLDLAVGGWLTALRLSTGSWRAPAVAHLTADLAGWWLR